MRGQVPQPLADADGSKAARLLEFGDAQGLAGGEEDSLDDQLGFGGFVHRRALFLCHGRTSYVPAVAASGSSGDSSGTSLSSSASSRGSARALGAGVPGESVSSVARRLTKIGPRGKSSWRMRTRSSLARNRHEMRVETISERSLRA